MMKFVFKHLLQWQAALKLVRWGTAQPLVRLIILDFLLFFVGVTVVTNVTGFIKNLRRRYRKFTFPHKPLDPVEVDGHSLKIYNYGGYAFRDMLKAIEEAEESIFLETYIFSSDEVGKEFKRRLIAKAKEGVRVCIAFDGFGALYSNRRTLRYPKEVQMSIFSRFDTILGLFIFGFYTRTHRKILVIDNKIAFLGGMNIGREYTATWRDTHVRVEGEVAQDIALSFAEIWNKNNKKPERRIDIDFARTKNPYLVVAGSKPSYYLGSKTIREHFIEAIKQAKNYILITNPYVLPDKETEREMLNAVKRGVRLEIIAPEKSNQWIVNLLARPTYKCILAAGGKIWFYQHTMIHSKTATIDGSWSTVGSANLDGRSLINLEINLFVDNQDFARSLEKMFSDDLKNCKPAMLKTISKAKVVRRCAEIIFRPVRSLV
jgi:cardiolipin synthase A/B